MQFHTISVRSGPGMRFFVFDLGVHGSSAPSLPESGVQIFHVTAKSNLADTKPPSWHTVYRECGSTAFLKPRNRFPGTTVLRVWFLAGTNCTESV
eukprot:3941280-Rhodomonas_salina.1